MAGERALTDRKSRLYGRERRERPFKARRFIMLVQVGLERERFVASLAFEMLKRGVGLHVRPQVGTVGERFSTVCTSKGLLARVRAHVAL